MEREMTGQEKKRKYGPEGKKRAFCTLTIRTGKGLGQGNSKQTTLVYIILM